MKTPASLTIFLFLAASFLFSATTKFEDVKIRRHKSPDKRQLVDRAGVLRFDDDAQKLTFQDDTGDNLSVPYSDVTKVVFDSDTHMNAGLGSLAIVPISPLGGNLTAAIHAHDRWFYFEYRQGDHPEKVLLLLPGSKSEKATAKVQTLFGDRVTIASYAEKGEPILDKYGDLDKRRIPDFKSKHSIKVDKTNHPLPEVKPDKATVVVVCPPLAGRITGLTNQFKLHANGRVIAVNKTGTYSIAYVDPGKYFLISQAENANGFDMDLEAGNTYYFIQETFQGLIKYDTRLSRNSPEVVLYLVDGAYFSNWKRLN